MIDREYLNVDDILCGIEIERTKNDKIRSTDIVNGDMIVCSICGKPRRKYVDYKGVKTICVCKCDCDIFNENEKKREEENKAISEQAQMLRQASHIDKMFYNATFQAFQVTNDNKNNLEKSKRYAKKFDVMYQNNQGLLFYGNTGTGKSFTAACIANALIDNLHTVLMTSFAKLLQSKFDEDVLSMLMRPELLIIDDLGAERNTSYAVEKMYAVIDGRYREQKPILLTTNLTLDEMKKANDIQYERIYDRIFEMCYPMQFKGVSRRKVAAKERYDLAKKLLEED